MLIRSDRLNRNRYSLHKIRILFLALCSQYEQVFSVPVLLPSYDDPEGKYEALEKYGKDLTAMARAGKLDPVIGRDDEIRRCIQILSRRTKNNPVLIGEPGVGKTAISEGCYQWGNRCWQSLEVHAWTRRIVMYRGNYIG
ncbi:hypothetical protein POM88_032987 [Heracleum sosnowskyi]|uniref:Uncharacterized protein n=1 Tax=Heracleum sosnowskyi TaxID=360622 RepID=A0AAD8I0G2_9APIA|nr:hypothetical protein POM88_032987 [Heracleum sosnowskyi]